MKKLAIRKLLIFLPVSLFLTFLMFACSEDRIDPEITGSIKGVIMDSETQEPVANVGISTNPATEVLLTDDNGEFILSDIETGSYKIIMDKDDYESQMKDVLVKENDTSFISVMLKKKESSQSADPPTFGEDFSPVSGASNLPTTLTLSWQAFGANESDSLYYDIVLYRSNSQSRNIVASNYKDTTIEISQLNYNTVYFWQIIARDQDGDTAQSSVRNFRTQPISDAAFFYAKKIDGNYEIMGYEIESGGSTRLTYNSFRDWAPKLNRTNDKIAFVSDSLVKNHIFIMSKNGQDIQQVTDIPVAGYNNYGNAFCWDERSGDIFFSHYSTLYRVNQDGTGLTEIATAPADRHFREVDVSPQGNKIIALTIGEAPYTNELYLMDIDGSNMTQIFSDLPGTLESPAFSIDGKSILFTHDISENEAIDGRQLNSHIFSYNFNTQDTVDLSQNKELGTNDLYPRYSNTGDKIVFVNVTNDNSTPNEIWMMDVDGTNREKLVSSATLPYW